MTFVSNHDKNSWDGTEFEQFGPGLEAAIGAVGRRRGLPLIYNGQEAGNSKRLAFFDRDPIRMAPHPTATCTGGCSRSGSGTPRYGARSWGARMIDVPNTAPAKVLSFVRMNERDKVFAVFNFSNAPVQVAFVDGLFAGTYQDFDSGAAVRLTAGAKMELPAWGYRVLTR